MITLWILVVVIFVGDVPAKHHVFGGTTKKECEDAIKEVEAAQMAKGASVWHSDCVELKHTPPKFQKDRDS